MGLTMQQLEVKKLVALVKLLRSSGQLSPTHKQLITSTLKEIGKN